MICSPMLHRSLWCNRLSRMIFFPSWRVWELCEIIGHDAVFPKDQRFFSSGWTSYHRLALALDASPMSTHSFPPLKNDLLLRAARGLSERDRAIALIVALTRYGHC